MSEKETIDHPLHYNIGIEVIELVELLDLNFSVGNWLKYFCRYKYKNNPIEDYKKALWYLKREFTHKSQRPFIYPIANKVNAFAKSWDIGNTSLRHRGIFYNVVEYVYSGNSSYLQSAIELMERELEQGDL